MLSFLLKALSAAALLASLIGFYVQISGRQLVDIVPQKHLGLVALGFLLLAGVLGAADYWVSRSNPATSQVNLRVGGDLSGPVAGRDVVQYGPTKEQMRQERADTERMIANEVVAQLGALARRQELIAFALRPDDFAAELDEARQAMAPSLATANAAGYRQLIAAETASSLRNALDSERLRSEPSDLLRQALLRANIDSERFDYFYQQMAEVERHTRALLRKLDELGRRPWSHGAAQLGELVQLDFNLLITANGLARQAGLRIVDGFADPLRSETQNRIALIQQTLAWTASPIDSDDLPPELRSLESLVAKRAELVRRSAKARDEALNAGLAEIEAMLMVNDGDSAQEVIGKARSLRGLGRIGEAVAAFERYALMFEATDPLARSYASLAQLFSQQITELGVQGGCYIGALEPDAPAKKAGLQQGDIIVAIDGIAVSNVVELIDELQAAKKAPIEVAYLRAEGRSAFSRETAHLSERRLGAELRAI